MDMSEETEAPMIDAAGKAVQPPPYDLWLPTKDIDVSLDNVDMLIDRVQLNSMELLGAYSKRWQQENETFMWKPPVRPSCSTEMTSTGSFNWEASGCRRWWLYAMHGVLRRIDASETWHLLYWLETRRRAGYRMECVGLLLERCAYIRYLGKTRSKGLGQLLKETLFCRGEEKKPQAWGHRQERRMEEIQVALPLADALFFWIQAEQIDAGAPGARAEACEGRGAGVDGEAPVADPHGGGPELESWGGWGCG